MQAPGGQVRRSIVVAVALVGLSASGCGKQSRTTPSAAARLTAICDEAGHELLTIDRHKIQPYPRFMGKLIEEAAEESEKVDEATATNVRRIPASPRTRQALADLARSRAELQAIVRFVQHHSVAVTDLPPGIMLRLLTANAGCFRVQARKPTPG